jgi:hypothetical protein
LRRGLVLAELRGFARNFRHRMASIHALELRCFRAGL